jgi:4'-phosphopantetheinyl transferase EntD
MIERVLPADVAVFETRGDLQEALFPVEATAIGSAVDKRRREFVTGRACARRALGQLGFPRCAVPIGPRGAPVWPHGAVGSLTHCAGFRAAAAARVEDYRSLGIDAEADAALPEGVLEVVALPDEREHLDALALTDPGTCWDRILFSAKESVFKAWFPLAQAWLGFEDAALVIEPTAGTFSARLLVPGPVIGSRPLHGFTGRWARDQGIVVTGVAVPI